MKTTRPSKSVAEMSASKLDAMSAEFDRELVSDTFGPIPRHMRQRLERAKRRPGHPRANARPAKNQPALSEMVRRIVQRFSPQKVILFGSHARGTAGPDSDVDLLVVMAVNGSRRQQAITIAAALHDIEAAAEVVVTTPEEFDWRQHVVGTLERPAAREGRILYER